jgi:Catalase
VTRPPGDTSPPHEGPRPDGEQDAIDRVVELVKAELRKDYESTRPILRGQHPKAHGCVDALFTVESDVPADLQHGIFAQPGTYEARIRFSASAAPPRSDRWRDAQGMSIKVRNVAPPGAPVRDQDFCLVNHDVFFCRDALDYAAFAEAVTARGAEASGLETKLRILAFYYPLTRANRRGLTNLWRVLRKDVTNPLHIQYWSQTPFALGPHAVKYSARPEPLPSRRSPKPPGYDGLQEAMARTLKTGGAGFHFLAQRQVDTLSMPVDDATIAWKETASPFRKVASIWIPAQDFTAQHTRNEAEVLFFTPWRSLEEHRPLGGINRVRSAVYEASFEYRRQLEAGAAAREAGGGPFLTPGDPA